VIQSASKAAGSEVPIRVAVDIGGTFTDLVLLHNRLGGARVVKVPSTPPDYSRGFLSALQKLSIPLSTIDLILHGTTAPLNALIEGRGAEVALVATEGFADVYKIGRGNRVRMYDLQYKNPEPLVPRYRIVEVQERLASDGRVLKPLTEEAVENVVRELRVLNVESIGICLLHSYANPVHEKALRDRLTEALPDVSVYASVDICREWREFERTSTTAVNAYLSPILSRYLTTLRAKLSGGGYVNPLLLMQSNGGLIDAALAEDRAVLTLMSGPVGGVAGCVTLGSQLAQADLICTDMGGTSFDFGVVVGGEPATTPQREFAGHPVLTASIDVHTIGAGGGSVAWTESGALRVGPHSAGADPGPACYNRGGEAPTVTDANLILGRIDPSTFLGGEMRLSIDQAYRAVYTLSEELGLDVERMAEGIVTVVNHKMANAIRSITIGKGLDPRGFSLVAYGGAGPLHAAAIAEELGVQHVVIPRSAGVFSAWGMLETDIRHERFRSVLRALAQPELAKLEAVFDELRGEVVTLLMSEGVPNEAMAFRRTLDMRYIGQEYYVGLVLDDDADSLSSACPSQIKARFDDLYEQIHGHKSLAEGVEIVNVRLEGIGRLHRGGDAVLPGKAASRRDHGTATRIIFNGEEHYARSLNRPQLCIGEATRGPAILSELSCTTFVPPKWLARLDKFGHLHLDHEE
jgi:N-methylhydantoinase A